MSFIISDAPDLASAPAGLVSGHLWLIWL